MEFLTTRLERQKSALKAALELHDALDVLRTEEANKTEALRIGEKISNEIDVINRKIAECEVNIEMNDQKIMSLEEDLKELRRKKDKSKIIDNDSNQKNYGGEGPSKSSLKRIIVRNNEDEEKEVGILCCDFVVLSVCLLQSPRWHTVFNASLKVFHLVTMVEMIEMVILTFLKKKLLFLISLSL